MLRNPWVRALLILLLAGVLAAYDWTTNDKLPILKRISCPAAGEGSSPFLKWFSDRCVSLGLDLAGGTQLRYRIDLGQVPLGQQDAIVDGIRDIMDRRVNTLGVSEPIVTPSTLNGQHYITVELPGTKDINEAIAKVGKTVLLEFKEQKTTLTDEEKKADEEFNARKKELATTTAARAKTEDFDALATELSEANPYGRGGKLEKKGKSDVYQDLQTLLFETLKPGEVSDAHEVKTNMQIDSTTGEQQEVTTGYSVVKLLSREDVTKEQYEPARATVTHLLVTYVGSQAATPETTRTKEDAKKFAEELLAKVNAGEDFGALIMEHSDDPSKEGNKGTFEKQVVGESDPTKNTFVKEFNDAIVAANTGDLVGPVETAFGFHIMKIGEKTPSKTESVTNPEVSYQEIFFVTRVPSDWRETGLTGKQFRSAVAQPVQNSFMGYEVAINFDEEGGKLFGELTKRNLNKQIAIFLDGQLISAPTVQTEITSGQAVITGNFSAEDASGLAKQLNTGALPAPITLVDQQQVEGSLGAASLEKALQAGLYGLLVLAAFLILYYRLPGLVATFALGLYALLLFALFRIWPGYTLSLAGIAGAILSIGMAVDANILIFERMKEELRSGKSLDLAVTQGFRRAWSSIRDSNVSSLITAAILTLIGTSVIRGFALTLALGIVTSMFTAITVTRGILLVLMRTPLARVHALWAAVRPFTRAQIDFYRFRHIFYAGSVALIAGAAILLGVFGARLGLDFTGGSLMEVRFQTTLPSQDALRSAMEEVATKPAAAIPGFVQSSTPAPTSSEKLFDASTAVIIPSTDGKGATIKLGQIDQATYERILTAFAKLNGDQAVEKVRFETIGPTIGEGLRVNTWKALFWAIVMMVLYIAFAFRRVPSAASPWTFGSTAVVALVHDVFITVGFFGLMGYIAGWEIDTLFVSAMLTVFGFSVHDTIVVFDRLRENLILHGREKGLIEVANDAVNQTLARSINTSLTTVITLTALAVFGPDTIRPFVVAMIFGMVIGMYSSIFVAIPLLVDWQRMRAKRLGR